MTDDQKGESMGQVIRMAKSAEAFLPMDFCLIFVPYGHHDEPKIFCYPQTF